MILTTTSAYNDQELAKMLTEKNVQAVLHLYDKYAPAVYGDIYRKTNNVKLAENILEQTFLHIWNNPSSVMNNDHLLFWILKVSREFLNRFLKE